MRIRSTELVEMRAGDLILDERNWRDHPVTQAGALQGVLEDVGSVFPVLVRETPAGFVVVDGHLRVSISAPDDMLSCLIQELDEREAGTVIATYDPVSELAQTDLAQLHGLAVDVRNSSLPHVASFLDILETVLPPEFGAESEGAHFMPVQQPEFSQGDPFLYPFSKRGEVWVWILHIPLDKFDGFIALARALALHFNIEDDSLGLVTHCLERVHATLD